MSFLQNESFGGSIALNEQKELRKKIINRWDGMHMLDGLDGILKENIATLYENQAKSMLTEATGANNSGSFETVVFPLLRRVFSRLLANDIVSVQAMNLPVGRLFFLKPVTAERDFYTTEGALLNEEPEYPTKDAYGRHTGIMGSQRAQRNDGGKLVNKFHLPDEVINLGLNPAKDDFEQQYTFKDNAFQLPKVTTYLKKTLYDLFYNDGLYDASKGNAHIQIGTNAYVGTYDFATNTFTEGTLISSNVDGKIRYAQVALTGFSSFNQGKLTGPDGVEVDTEEFLASLKAFGQIPDKEGQYKRYDFRLLTQKWGEGIITKNVKYTDITGKSDILTNALLLEISFAEPSTTGTATADGYIGIDADKVPGIRTTRKTGEPGHEKTEAVEPNDDKKLYFAWKQYDSLEFESNIGEVSFQITDVTVSVTGRKLRATWSPELAQDVNAFHNIDAEAELSALLSEQMGMEIDREILRDLRKAAPWVLRFDYNGWKKIAPTSTNYTQKDWNQMLVTKINQISAQIHKATLQGGANFIVVSSEVSAIFDDLEYFHASTAAPEEDQYNMGIERIGNLTSRYQVYRDPYSPSKSVILGHKGSTMLDTGYIYAPYIPMQLTPTLTNTYNFVPVKGIMTRYAKKCVNNRYYGQVIVDGLVEFNIDELR